MHEFVFYLEENGNKHSFPSVGARLFYEAEHKVMKGKCWHAYAATPDIENDSYTFDLSFNPDYYK
jgi:hypothetical protein